MKNDGSDSMSVSQKFRSAADLKEEIDRVRKASQKSGKVLFEFAMLLSPGDVQLPEDWKQQLGCSYELAIPVLIEAYSCLLREAEGGNGESMHLVGMYHQTGWPPVQQNMSEFHQWCEKAFNAGYVFAGNDLYSFYLDRNSPHYDPERAAAVLATLEETGNRVA